MVEPFHARAWSRSNARVARAAGTRRSESGLPLQIAVSAGNLFPAPPICQGVAVRKKVRISGMRLAQLAIVPDGTEMLFSACRDFRNKREQAVGIGTVNTADPFYGVEIRQTASIEDQVFAPPDLGDAENREANCLIEYNEQVQ